MLKDKIIYPQVKMIKPFFWKECRFCGKEFKREKGFSIWDYTRVNAYLYTSYCCSKCAKDIESVEMLVKKSKISSPPPPPSRQR